MTVSNTQFSSDTLAQRLKKTCRKSGLIKYKLHLSFQKLLFASNNFIMNDLFVRKKNDRSNCPLVVFMCLFMKNCFQPHNSCIQCNAQCTDCCTLDLLTPLFKFCALKKMFFQTQLHHCTPRYLIFGSYRDEVHIVS